MFTIREEVDDDWWEVEALFDKAFLPGRSALSSYRLREDVSPVAPLCLVARDEADQIAGAVRHWPVRVGGSDALLLGPIAVHPTRQGEGLGEILIGEAISRATALGWARVILVGDLEFYARFGFARAPQLEMPRPTNPERILARALVAGAMDDISGAVEKAT